MKQWRGRNVLDDAEDMGLEATAGQHELRGGMPREVAERKAHEDYMSERALDAAAHHYRGMAIANAAGHEDEAAKHAEAYAAAAKLAGFSATDAPQAVLDRLKNLEPGYAFKAHAADALITPPEQSQP